MFPEAFENRMNALLGVEAPQFWAAMQEKPSRALRLNEEKLSPEELKQILGDGFLGKAPFPSDAYYFDYDGIGNLPLHHGGAVYVQEPNAMAPVAALPKMEVSSILDLCAAPGGKSLQAAQKCLLPDGVLVCNEPTPIRRKALLQNLERMGEKRGLVTGFDATEIPSAFFHSFDLVLADVPCSGEGMMRKEEDARLRWSEDVVKNCAALQKKILQGAARCVREGGFLLYSTCTWSLEENEEQIASFLSEHPEFRLLSPSEEVEKYGRCGFAVGENKETEKTLRFYPHTSRGEGQFLAVLKKEGEASPLPVGKREKKEKKEKKKEPCRAVAEAFLKEVLKEDVTEEILIRGEEVFLAPKHSFPKELFVSLGVPVGSVQKGRMIPHHRFFTSHAAKFRQTVVLPQGDGRAEAYLRGEEIPCEGKGYAALFLEKIPLGGVRVSDGRGKNLYPKGLRKK